MGAMGLMDKVKASAEIGLAKATEAGKAGQAKLDAAQAKHKADGLLRDLGAAVYADHVGKGSDGEHPDRPSASWRRSRPTRPSTGLIGS